VVSTQNRAQRGFTAGASPTNPALLVEEIYRESKESIVWFKLKSTFFNTAKDIFMCFLHIPPENSSYTVKNGDDFDTPVLALKSPHNIRFPEEEYLQISLIRVSKSSPFFTV
jgi:hypothetical protein